MSIHNNPESLKSGRI